MAVILAVLVLVRRFAIYFQETIKLDNLALGCEYLLDGIAFDGNGGFLNLCIGHLTSDGTLPNQIVEFALLGTAFDLCHIHV